MAKGIRRIYPRVIFLCAFLKISTTKKRPKMVPRGLPNEKSKQIGIETGGEYFGKTVGLFEKLLNLFVESLSMLRVTLVRENCLN